MTKKPASNETTSAKVAATKAAKILRDPRATAGCRSRSPGAR